MDDNSTYEYTATTMDWDQLPIGERFCLPAELDPAGTRANLLSEFCREKISRTSWRRRGVRGAPIQSEHVAARERVVHLTRRLLPVPAAPDDDRAQRVKAAADKIRALIDISYNLLSHEGRDPVACRTVAAQLRANAKQSLADAADLERRADLLQLALDIEALG